MNIQNSEVGDDLRSSTKIDTLQMPLLPISGSAIPVIDATPRNFRNINLIESRTSVGTLLTTDANKDTIIYGVLLIGTKAAGDTGTELSVTCRLSGASKILNFIVAQTSTAESRSQYLEFAKGIKVDKGSVIAVGVTGTWTSVRAVVYGTVY